MLCFLLLITFVGLSLAEDSTVGNQLLDPQKERIVGGSITSPGRWPWQLSLQMWSGSNRAWYHICGASLLTLNKALTAAHCVQGISASNMRVVAGEHRLSVNENREQVLKVSLVSIHPGYAASNGYPNDIAILTLSSSADTSSSYVSTIPYATSGTFANQYCYIVGWGKTSSSSGVSDYLREALIPVITNTDCRSRWSFVSSAPIYSSHICVYAGGKGACNGDSGGPILCKSGDRYVVAGIASWAIKTCVGYPTVYTRVTSFANWIQQNL